MNLSNCFESLNEFSKMYTLSFEFLTSKEIVVVERPIPGNAIKLFRFTASENKNFITQRPKLFSEFQSFA